MFFKIKYMFLKNIHLVSLREHRTYVLVVVGKFFQKINFSKKQKNNFSKKSNFPEKFIFRVYEIRTAIPCLPVAVGPLAKRALRGGAYW